jgi:hypothetical protein
MGPVMPIYGLISLGGSDRLGVGGTERSHFKTVVFGISGEALKT